MSRSKHTGVWFVLAWASMACGAAPDDTEASGGSSGSGAISSGGTGTGGASGGSTSGGAASGGAPTGGAASGGSSGASSGGGSAGSDGQGGTSGSSSSGGTAPVTGDPGVWENVTPAGVSIDPNYVPATNFGVMDVLADPVRHGDFYAFICYQGVWRSTDNGLTWTKVSTGTNGSVLETGRPWTAAIDNDTGRDPETAPALYTANGYGSELGVFKSTDWGVNWTKYFANEDIYSFAMDPYDNQHLVTGMHEGPGLAESTDAGVSWVKITTGGIGKSIYPHFIDTGSAETTRDRWLVVSQIDSGTGAAMTTDGGTSFGSAMAFGHPHGGNQLFNDGSGVAYVGASGGVWRTTDSGANWATIDGSTDHGYANGVLGTAEWLYSWDDGANAGGIGSPHLMRAPRNPGTEWSAMETPSAMNNGGKTMATSTDGEHYVLISGSWNAGIWRYVEP